MVKVDQAIVKKVVDKCDYQALLTENLSEFMTSADQISYCFNTELGAYGLKTYVSPDKSYVYIDDEGMSKVLSFFKGKEAQPVLTSEHVQRIQTIVETAQEKKINLIWLQQDWRKHYYLFKQYGFHGANIYGILSLNTVNAAAALTSATGAVAMSAAGAMALSYSGSLFLSTLDNYIPNSWVRTKTSVGLAKVVVSFPLHITEKTTNVIFGSVEKLIIGTKLPTNVTAAFAVDKGPRLSSFGEIKKTLGELLYKWGKEYFGDSFS